MEKIYKLSEIKEFEVKILAAGGIKIFLPMSFVVMNSNIRVHYQTQGYVALSEAYIKSPWEVLDVIEQVILGIKEAENHMMLLSRYCLSKESIFIKPETRALRFLFMPLESSQEDGDFGKKIVALLGNLKTDIQEVRTMEYVDRIICKMVEMNLTKQGLLHDISELKREVHLCGWGVKR